MPRKSQILHTTTLLLFLLSLTSFTNAQTGDYREYTIEKGDTLWDISNKELQDPFLWPKVWKENPAISNPDKIYPGQSIRVPLYLMQKEIIPEVKPAPKPRTMPERPAQLPVEKRAEPVRKSYLVDKNLLIVSGYITDKVHSIGAIYDTPGETSNISKGDYAYIKTDRPVKKGEKVYIIYPVEEVKHPVTGRTLGTRIAILGSGEVVDEKDPKILITTSYVEIPIGSLIDNYYEIEPPLAIENPRKPNINGYIVTTLRRLSAHGIWDVVFIDKGKNDGVEVGDMLATSLRSEHKIFNGLIQIISRQPSTSAAIIRKSSKEIEIGDEVTGVTDLMQE